MFSARVVEGADPYNGCRIYLRIRYPSAFPFRGNSPWRGKCHEVTKGGRLRLEERGTALAVDEGSLYHGFYGTRYQFYVMQICSISRVVEGADPYNRRRLSYDNQNGRFVNRPYTVAVYLYGKQNGRPMTAPTLRKAQITAKPCISSPKAYIINA